MRSLVASEDRASKLASRDPAAIRAPSPGQLLGEFRIQSRLATGGSSCVFAGVHQATGQAAAIKLPLVPDHLPTAQARLRLRQFLREISICAQLQHPDVVRLLAAGRWGEVPYAAFEFVPGPTLAEVLEQRGALTVAQSLELAAQLLDVLAYLHGLGSLHRDLKPSNLVLVEGTLRPRIKLLDFGLATPPGSAQVGAAAGRELSRASQGTPRYAAPEQLRGEDATTAGDLYSLGLVLLECLTGSHAISGPSPAAIVAEQLSERSVPLPPSLRHAPWLELFEWLCAKEPSRRATSAAQVLARLELLDARPLADREGMLAEAARPRGRSAVEGTVTNVAMLAPHRERRLVTVACIRLVVEGDERLSSESVDRRLRELRVRCRAVVERRGGALAGVEGDHLVAYFGHARVRGDEARLAARAALELAALSRSNASPWTGARLRIGLHAGAVEMEAGCEPGLTEGTTLAVALALAERSPAEASGTARILASASFRDLLRASGGMPLEGSSHGFRVSWSERVWPAYELREGAGADDGAFRSDFVGREHELAILQALWDGRARMGSVVLIHGEAGIGKSRLARQWGAGIGLSPLICQCSPERLDDALFPVLDLLVRALGLDRVDGPERWLEQLGRRVQAAGFDATRAVPVLAAWLSLPLPEGYAPSPDSPAAQRQMAFEVSGRLIVDATLAASTYLLVEDLHWADSSTRAWLSSLSERAAEAQLVVVATSRERERLPELGHLHRVELDGLPAGAAERLCRQVAPMDAPALDESQRIHELSGGNPLYMQELAKELSDRRRSAQHDDRVPPTLRSLLEIRLDRLGIARRTVEDAAALGPTFDAELLAAISPSAAQALDGDLEQLARSGVLVTVPGASRPRLQFSHTLFQRVAYDRMPEDRRQKLHQRIVEALLGDRDGARDHSTIARHCGLSGAYVVAVRHWLEAARRSARLSAHDEGLECLTSARRALERVPPGVRDRATLELHLEQVRGGILLAKAGYGSDAVRDAFAGAERLLATREASPEQRFLVQRGLWSYHNVRGPQPVAWRLARSLADQAKRLDRVDYALAARTALCQTAFGTGRLDAARLNGERARALYDYDRDHSLVALYGDDVYLTCLSFEALALLIQGQVDAAASLHDAGGQHARRLGMPGLMAGWRAQSAWLHLVRGDLPAPGESPGRDWLRAESDASEAVRLARAHGFPFWEAYGATVLSIVRALCGQAEAIAGIRAGIEAWKAVGARLGLSWQLSYLALALGLHGHFREGLRSADEAIAHCDETSERYFEAEAWRIRALLCEHPDNPERSRSQAVDAAREAARRARARGARWLALRAQTTLCRSQPDEAPVLAASVSAFSRLGEGLSTPSFAAARRLLNAITPSPTQPTREDPHAP